MERELTCIVCPIGCKLQISGENSGKTDNLTVTGNQCKRGIPYAHDEITNPTRMVCSTVKIKGGIHPVLPVKTNKPIPEKYKLEIVKLINQAEVTSPVKTGDIIVPDAFGTGVNVVATRNM